MNLSSSPANTAWTQAAFEPMPVDAATLIARSLKCVLMYRSLINTTYTSPAAGETGRDWRDVSEDYSHCSTESSLISDAVFLPLMVLVCYFVRSSTQHSTPKITRVIFYCSSTR